jgi:hypothetical protein
LELQSSPLDSLNTEFLSLVVPRGCEAHRVGAATSFLRRLPE